MARRTTIIVRCRARALQENAVTLALKAFGQIDGATSVSLPGRETALGTVRLLEDAVIEHDARWIPGWHLADRHRNIEHCFSDAIAEAAETFPQPRVTGVE